MKRISPVEIPGVALRRKLNAVVPMQTVTPVWGATGGNPTIGNGTLSGYYEEIGGWATFSVRFVVGGTTDFDSGTAWTFAPPAAFAKAAIGFWTGIVRASVAATTGVDLGGAQITDGVSTVSIASQGGTSNWGVSVPGAWASGDAFHFSIRYWVGL